MAVAQRADRTAGNEALWQDYHPERLHCSLRALARGAGIEAQIKPRVRQRGLRQAARGGRADMGTLDGGTPKLRMRSPDGSLSTPAATMRRLQALHAADEVLDGDAARPAGGDNADQFTRPRSSRHGARTWPGQGLAPRPDSIRGRRRESDGFTGPSLLKTCMTSTSSELKIASRNRW